MKKFYAILNTVIIFLVIFWNYWSNTRAINGNTVGSLSDQYANLFTPAGYAFSIWGIIFLSLIALAMYQIKLAFWSFDDSNSILKIGPWLSIANIGNAAWLWFWLNEQTAISVIIMLLILFSLIKVILRLNMARWDAPVKEIIFIWWPISFYSGWIAVATIANISAYLAKTGWIAVFSEVQWTIIMISIAGLLNLFMIYTRNMREFAVVGIWAISAIAVRHSNDVEVLKWTSIFWAVILSIAVSVHAARKTSTNPFTKLLKK